MKNVIGQVRGFSNLENLKKAWTMGKLVLVATDGGLKDSIGLYGFTIVVNGSEEA